MSEPTPLSAAAFIKQTAFGDPDGNCLEACFASLTKIPLQDIPHFLQDAWFFHYKQWFRERGWHIELFDRATPFPGFAIASGPAERGIDHACVYLDGKLFHDPHPSNAGLLSVTDYILVWPTLEAQNAQATEIAALKGALEGVLPWLPDEERDRVYRAARHRYNVSEGGRDETDELNELEQQRNAAFGIVRRVLAGKEAQGEQRLRENKLNTAPRKSGYITQKWDGLSRPEFHGRTEEAQGD